MVWNSIVLHVRTASFFSILFLTMSVTAQNRVWIDTVAAAPHQEVRFSLYVANATSVAAFQSDIVFPSVLTYVANSAELTVRSNGHSLAAVLISSNRLRIIIYSLSGNALNGTEGAILTFLCRSGAIPGEYSLEMHDAIAGGTAGENVIITAYCGKFTLLAPDIHISNDSLDFGRIPLGQAAELPVTITNNGNLSLSLATISSSHAEMVMTDSSATSIDAFGSIVRTVRFQPLSKGSKSGTISIGNTDPVDSLRTIQLRGDAYAVNEIRIGYASARSGYSAAIRVGINNMEPFTAFQCRIPLPAVMKYTAGSAHLIARNDGHTISADTTAGNVLQIICFSTANKPFAGFDGEIVEFQCTVEGQGGNYAIPVDGAIITDSTGMNILSASYAGELRIASPIIRPESSSVTIGSVSVFDTARIPLHIDNNGDDTLVISSAEFLDPSYVVESSLPFIVPPGTDNAMMVRFHHGTRGTYPAQMTLIHNDAPRNPSRIAFTASTYIPNVLNVLSTSGSFGDTVAMAVRLDNAEPITALQFDLRFPAGSSFVPGSLTAAERSAAHSLSTSTLVTGAIRTVLFSMSAETFPGASGDVARFSVVLPGFESASQIILENVVVSNSENENVVSGTGNAWIDVYPAAARWRANPAAGTASVTSFDSTGVTLTGDITVTDAVIVSYYDREPRAGRLPSGIYAAGKYFWKMSRGALEFTDGKVAVPLEKLKGVVDPNELVWLMRESADDPWVNIGGSVVLSSLESLTPFNSLSEFTVGTTSPVNPLPMQLTHFNAAHMNGSVCLSWSTAAETDNYGFEIERKCSETPWRQIGFVEGFGTCSTPKEYRFIDKTIRQGIVQYRLKQVDNNGRFRYSPSTAIVITAPDRFSLMQNYPNPFNAVTVIAYTISEQRLVRLTIYDLLGKEIAVPVNEVQEKGFHTVTFDASMVPSGLYFYSLQTETYRETKRMVLIK